MDAHLLKLYDFIEAYKAKHGYSPSHEEIAASFGISKTHLSQLMAAMETQGMIVQPRGLLKAIKLLPRRPEWNRLETR
jgi:SOS-response transcriptional repressor LexA